MKQTLLGCFDAPTKHQTITSRIYAVACERIAPEGWMHLCITAAQEAEQAEVETGKLRSRDDIAQCLDHLRNTDGLTAKCWEVEHLVELGNAYVKGKLGQNVGGGAAQLAFRNNMPPLSSRANIQAFVCCTMAGMLRGYLTGKDANALLYGAQQALAAYPKRKRGAKKGQ